MNRKSYRAEEVADMLGISRQRVYVYASRGELKGQKWGRDWRFSASAIQAFKGQRRPPGRPRLSA